MTYHHSPKKPTNEQNNELIQHYLIRFCDGEIPLEAFLIDTPIRTHAETIFSEEPVSIPNRKPEDHGAN